MKRHFLFVVLALLVASNVSAEKIAPVTALVTTETTQVDAEGVTTITRFQERLWRDDGHVWIERVYPAGMKAQPGAHGLNLGVAARFYTRVGADDVRTVLVSVPDRTVVEIGRESYAGLGVSARWSVAAQILDRSRVRPDVHYKWSARYQLPLVIESTTADGRVKTRVTVEPAAVAPGTALPWTRLDGFTHRDLSDLED
jgi:hypothetical protein